MDKKTTTSFRFVSLTQVASATSFSRVKAAKGVFAAPYLNKGKSLYRRGEVGNWRKHFTVALNEAVDEVIQREWKGTPLLERFDYG